jgi:hypothetical protein
MDTFRCARRLAGEKQLDRWKIHRAESSCIELIAALICLSARANSHPTPPLNPSALKDGRHPFSMFGLLGIRLFPSIFAEGWIPTVTVAVALSLLIAALIEVARRC